ncbi:hypothetical protein LY76DRAFT_49868 [Colletotrichum caudatum]|nr:hypothetical protein LY76DRAFT_49868 [Colletotrichum caudatum]
MYTTYTYVRYFVRFTPLSTLSHPLPTSDGTILWLAGLQPRSHPIQSLPPRALLQSPSLSVCKRPRHLYGNTYQRFFPLKMLLRQFMTLDSCVSLLCINSRSPTQPSAPCPHNRCSSKTLSSLVAVCHGSWVVEVQKQEQTRLLSLNAASEYGLIGTNYRMKRRRRGGEGGKPKDQKAD